MESQAWDSSHQPSPTIARALVLQHQALAFTAFLQKDMHSGQGRVDRKLEDMLALELGGAVGITNNIELGMALPFVLSPAFNLREVRCYGSIGLIDSHSNPFNMALRSTVVLPLSKNYLQWMGTDFVFAIETPLRYRLSALFSLEGTVSLGLAESDGIVGFAAFDPGFLVQVTRRFSLAGQVGVHYWAASQSAALFPVKLQATYSQTKDWDLVFDLALFDLNYFYGKHFSLMIGSSLRF